MRQLAELSDGLGPASALADGLGPALDRLAAQSSVPAVADGPVGRLPPLVEATAFFVCSEGLANVAKHAHASRVSIRAREVDGRLFVEVVDDGVGGATPSPGSGLDGLRQRVETTGGRLTIEDRREGGTRLLAELPIDRRAGLGSLWILPVERLDGEEVRQIRLLVAVTGFDVQEGDFLQPDGSNFQRSGERADRDR